MGPAPHAAPELRPADKPAGVVADTGRTRLAVTAPGRAAGGTRVLEPGESFAGCRIEALAGRGEMGLVYRARELRAERLVALKVIRPELSGEPGLRARFARESRLATQISHPNIIPVHRVGEEDGVQFMIMGFVEGVGLDELRRLHGRLAPGHAARLVSQIAGALDAVHAQGFVHRDVKPGNVLVTGTAPHEHLYLTDFGLAKRIDEGCDLTGIGGYVGTPDYIPPEQASGDQVDARSDVYALGCLLYELLSGRVPFPRENHFLTIFAHLSLPVPVPSEDAPDIPVGFDRVIAGAMSKDPAARYRSASDLARAAVLAAAAGGAQPRRDGPAELAAP